MKISLSMYSSIVLTVLAALLINGRGIYAQVILNGDFENNTAVFDQINLSNVAFNGFMQDVNAFGTFGNMDIITSNTWGGGGAQNGSWYVALTGNGTDMIAMTLNAPLVSGNTYCLSFYDRKDPGYQAFPVEVGLSTSNAAFGTSVYTAISAPTNNVWTQRSFTFVAPNNGQYITVRQSAGGTGDWLHIDNFAFTVAAPSNILGNDTSLCSFPYTLDATTSGATYLWNDNSTQATLSINAPGIYWVDITTSCGTVRDSIHIQSGNTPVNLGNDTAICGSLVLDATTPGATYLWSNNSTQPTLTVNTPGTYWVEVSVGNCPGRDTIVITQAPPPVVDLGNDAAICNGNSVILDATTPGATYLWSNNSTQPTLTVNTPGTYWVEVNVGGCTGRDTIVVTQAAPPVVNLGNDTTICFNSTLTLDATTPNATYLWQDNSTNATFTVNFPGIYSVEVNVGGCTVTDTIQVSMAPVPSVNLGNDATICEGTSLVLNVTLTDATYLWQDNSTNPTFTVTETGTYHVTVTANGCGNSDTISVTVIPLTVIDLPDTSFCQGDSVLLDVSSAGGDTYLWQDSSSSATYLVTVPGMYWVEISAGGCSYTDSILVEEKNCNVEIQMPNVFSPNGDGINDDFIPLVFEGIVQAQLVIYNRWGLKLFETGDVPAGWNGEFNGNICAEGTYYWIVYYTDIFNNSNTLSGFVTLLTYW